MTQVSSAQAVLRAAYRCFCRTGYRHTTMSDIVAEARLSRPTVYKYAGSKEEAFRTLVRLGTERGLRAARDAAAAANEPEEKVLAVLSAKLEVALRLWRDSPAHAQGLLADSADQNPGAVAGYTDGLAALLQDALGGLTAPGAALQAAAVLLTFTRGLEDDLHDPDAARGELIAGIRMISRGALAAA